MFRIALLTLLLAAGCATPHAVWDDGVAPIEPLGEINAPQGLLIVRTYDASGRQAEGDPTHRGFTVLDTDGHDVFREAAFWEDWGGVRLFPGRYMVLSFVGEGVLDRRWEKAQVLVQAGKITAVDFVAPKAAKPARVIAP